MEIWSGMFIPDPDFDFYPSWIPDPGDKRHRIPDPDWQQLPLAIIHSLYCCLTFFSNHKFSQNCKYFILWTSKENNLIQLIKEVKYRYFLSKKLSLSTQKYGLVVCYDRISGSGKNLYHIQGWKKSTGSRIRSATLRKNIRELWNRENWISWLVKSRVGLLIDC